MKLTEIDFFYNTPFNDFQNFIHFKTDKQRDDFFTGRYNMKIYEPARRFNFVKDRLELRTRLTTLETYGLNYLRFRSMFDNDRWYYARVMDVRYINDGVTALDLVLDVVTTFMQGDFTKDLGLVQVQRMSLAKNHIYKWRKWLMTNNDVLNFPKSYTRQFIEAWKNYFVVFTTSVSLLDDFGTEDDPKLKTSVGQTYDGIVSPVDLYCCKSQDDFTSLMKYLKDYPWISQNINNVAIIPSEVVDEKDLVKVTSAKQDGINSSNIYQFKNKGKTRSFVMNNITLPKENFDEYFNFDDSIPFWALRQEYANIELNAWNGQQVTLAPVFLPDYGLKMIAQSTFGYHNEIRCFPDQYKDDGENSINGLYRGTYINQGITFDVFDDIPVLVDNYKLGKAQTAHQRALNNDRQISSRISDVLNPNKSLQDRFFNAVSLTTSLAGGGVLGVAKNALGQFTSEWEYYRDQNAKFADMAISAPSVGSQNNSQSFNMSKGIFGVTVRFASIGTENMERVLTYYNTFGFDFSGQLLHLEKPDTLPMLNYYQFAGNWILPGVPPQFMEQLKVQCQNGIKLWKNNNTDNPFTQNTRYNMED
jgi:tail protein|nr:MAG TPA: Major tail protein [Caudoviricetes sp.]